MHFRTYAAAAQAVRDSEHEKTEKKTDKNVRVSLVFGFFL